MFNFVRWYNQNRGKFWLIIVITIGVIYFIQTINNFYVQNSKNKTEEEYIKQPEAKETINNEISGQLDSQESLIDGYSISSEYLKSDISVIDKFIENCNKGNVEDAYNALTDECKENVFPTLESFKTKYYDNIFKTYKTYSAQNWSGNTYRLKLMEDALTSGKVSSTYLEEYVTVEKKDSEYKLNINNYIGRKYLNKTTTEKEFTVEVISKDTYMDFSEYSVKIKNTSDKTILLDSGEKTDTIYLLDKNDVKEYVNRGEIIYSNLELKPNESRTYNFKFSNTYSNTRVMQYLVFDKVILDYDLYNQTVDKSMYDNYKEIMINV